MVLQLFDEVVAIFKIAKNSHKVIIVVHEIYGINQHMIEVCKLLSSWDFDIVCPNLLEQDVPFSYSEEETAYDNFTRNIGFKNAVDKVENVLLDVKDRYEKVYIVGFSVGATIAWLCSERNDLHGIVGFYGSQIRNHVHIEPVCPVLLFFGEKEESFHVDELIVCLRKKIIEVHKLKGQHGFCDPYSKKYHIKSTQEAYDKMASFLLKH